MSSAETLLAWLDREIDEAQAELRAELSQFDRLFDQPGSLEDTDGRARRITQDVPFGMALEGLTAADLSYNGQSNR